MPSNVAKGAYYKARTRRWLESQGYQVGEMEIVRWIFTKGGRIPVKRDQFGSDLFAMSETKLFFVQVKGGESAAGGTFPQARREFAKYRFPPFVGLRIVAWAPRSREPRVIDGRLPL